MSDKNTFNIENLKSLIDKHTREEIAKGIGCDTSLVTKHYNGDRNITLDYAIKYADFFNVSLDYICGRSSVASSDKDISFIGDYTGLKIETIQSLHENNNNDYYENFVEFINYFFTSEFLSAMEYNLYWYDSECDELYQLLRRIDLEKYLKLNHNKKDLFYLLKIFTDLDDAFYTNIEDMTTKKYIIVKKFEKLLDKYLKDEDEFRDEFYTKIHSFVKNKRNLSTDDIDEMKRIIKGLIDRLNKER